MNIYELKSILSCPFSAVNNIILYFVTGLKAFVFCEASLTEKGMARGDSADFAGQNPKREKGQSSEITYAVFMLLLPLSLAYASQLPYKGSQEGG